MTFTNTASTSSATTSSSTSSATTSSYISWHNKNSIERKYYSDDIDLTQSSPGSKLLRELKDDYNITLSMDDSGKFGVNHIPDYTDIDIGNRNKITIETNIEMKRFKKPILDISVNFIHTNPMGVNTLFGKFEDDKFLIKSPTGWFNTVMFYVGDFVSTIKGFYGKITKINGNCYTIENEKKVKAKPWEIFHRKDEMLIMKLDVDFLNDSWRR
jgi:hypothetical protein